MSFIVDKAYSFNEILRLYNEIKTDEKELTRGGFLNPSKGNPDALIRAIFAKQSSNGPLTNILFVAGDNEHRNYLERINKAKRENAKFLYFNKVNHGWVYQGESQVVTLLSPTSAGLLALLNDKGYSLEVAEYEQEIPLWQLYKDGEPYFSAPRKVEFVAVISSESDPLVFSEIETRVTGRTGMAVIRIRLDQQAFSRAVNRRYKGKCIITHALKAEKSRFIHACHICDKRDAERNFADNSDENGLLLRADLHALFDERLLSINPQTGVVTFASEALQALYPEYHNQPCKSWPQVSAATKKRLAARELALTTGDNA